MNEGLTLNHPEKKKYIIYGLTDPQNRLVRPILKSLRFYGGKKKKQKTQDNWEGKGKRTNE